MKREFLLGFLWLVIVAVAGCADPDPATTPILPRGEYAPALPNLEVDNVMPLFVDQGFEQKEIHATNRIGWRCTLKRSDTVTLALHMAGTARDRIEQVDASLLNFDKINRDSEARDFFIQVARAVYTGRDSLKALEWIRENTGRVEIIKFEKIQFELGAGGNLVHIRIRWDPDERFNQF